MFRAGRGTAGGGRAWIRNTLVVAEVALSLLLLIGASLFVRSFLNLQQANGGFDASPLMTMRFYMANEQYATPEAKVQLRCSSRASPSSPATCPPAGPWRWIRSWRSARSRRYDPPSEDR